jgi:hypothetical protein
MSRPAADELAAALDLEWDQRVAMLAPEILVMTFEFDEVQARAEPLVVPERLKPESQPRRARTPKPRRPTLREMRIETARRKLARRGIEVRT